MIIAHIDMDAFFASVEERDKPYLKDLPIVIGADPAGGTGRGVVSTANYLAREYGIHSAMPISKAWRLSEEAGKRGKPKVVFLAGAHDRYGQISSQIMAILRKFGPLEIASVDEGYLDLSHLKSFKKATLMAKEIKKEIKRTEKLTASIGIGSNKMMAKIASGSQKPDGLTVIKNQQVKKFLQKRDIRDIPGIGPQTEKEFHKLKIFTIGDLQKIDDQYLFEYFGKWGRELAVRAKGIDTSPLITNWISKSIGEQETFEEDIKDYRQIFPIMERMAKSIHHHLIQEGFKSYKKVVITTRFADFETRTHSNTFKRMDNSSHTLYHQALSLLMPFLDRRKNPFYKKFRLIGVRVENLE